ncbi:hypothetical protein [Desulfovibrio psychrotolerans]|uniref:Uncharacterized protein n=1 Tax=Desulfovibrio psychrotolerans TaxID=415242 RepID=A0A7J0BSB8_9BACT|nr:hypothetical protein [Desulfovibrio psychrotolerans]GFM36579.1 hypothetical protein DSM19430T_12630 [Desulfovibrio psychrotolerans]
MTDMAKDRELGALLELDEEALTDLLATDYERVRREARDEEARMLSYLADLREVLRVDSGAGVRVLRHWLDGACANERLSRTNASVYGATALYDYARDRMGDIALADPVSHVRMQLEGARQWACRSMSKMQPAPVCRTGNEAARGNVARGRENGGSEPEGPDRVHTREKNV